MKLHLSVPAMALLLVFAGCGDADTATEGPETDDVGDTAQQPALEPDDPTTTGEPDATDPVDPPSTTTTEAAPEAPTPDRWATTPLAQYWGYAELDSEAFWEQELAKDRAVEELIVTCMAEQGFEYIPFLSPFHPAYTDVTGPETPGLSADEYREQYGYGISTDIEPSQSSAIEVVNPNQPIWETMSATEREAYNRALAGDPLSITESTPLAERGCSGQAVKEVRGVELALYDQLGDERRQLRQRIDNDPRVVQATLEWSRCMGQAGYAYATPDDIQQELFDRSEPYQMLGDPYEVLTQAQIDALSPDELEEVVAELSALSPEEQAVLDELQAFEIAVAAADHHCGIPLDDVRYDVTVELEQTFVDEHLAQLEAIVTARGS